MNNKDEQKLLPCPLDHEGDRTAKLDENPWEDNPFYVECVGCGIELRNFASASEAITAWNRRSPSAAPSRDGVNGKRSPEEGDCMACSYLDGVLYKRCEKCLVDMVTQNTRDSILDEVLELIAGKYCCDCPPYLTMEDYHEPACAWIVADELVTAIRALKQRQPQTEENK